MIIFSRVVNFNIEVVASLGLLICLINLIANSNCYRTSYKETLISYYVSLRTINLVIYLFTSPVTNLPIKN